MSDEQLQRLVGRSVTVSVPATIANLGVGYDVLGMAIDERGLFGSGRQRQSLERIVLRCFRQLAREFDATLTLTQWVVLGYVLAVTGLLVWIRLEPQQPLHGVRVTKLGGKPDGRSGR